MERSVVISGVLIAASFLLAVLLNRAVVDELEERNRAVETPLTMPQEPVRPIAVPAVAPPEPCDCTPEPATEIDAACLAQCQAPPD